MLDGLQCPLLPQVQVVPTPRGLDIKPSSINCFSYIRARNEGQVCLSCKPNFGRREVLVGFGTLTTIPFLDSRKALAEKAPSGYQAVLDNADGYAFYYPFGWQQVSVKGQDVVFKDVIEPLESVSISIISTDKKDLHEFGSPTEVANALVEKVLTAPNQKPQLLKAEEKSIDGDAYYTFEFLAKAPNFTRHALSTITVSNGKFYALTTGANERRWSKVQDKLQNVVQSFKLLK